MTARRPRTLWKRWNRGLATLWIAFLTLMFGLLPVWFWGELSWRFADGPMTKQVVGWAVFLFFVVVSPLLVSTLKFDPETVRAETVARVEPQVDRLAAQLGVSFADHFVTEVDALIREGKLDEARVRHQMRTHGTWDDTDRALADWPTTAINAKLAIVSEHLRAALTPPSPG